MDCCGLNGLRTAEIKRGGACVLSHLGSTGSESSIKIICGAVAEEEPNNRIRKSQSYNRHK